MALHERLIKFVDSIKKGYSNMRIVDKITRITLFSNQNLPFVQITDGEVLPKIDFTDNWKVSNDFLGQQIGESIAYGEINHLIKTLEEKISVKKNLTFFNLKTFEELLKNLEFTPTHILLPIDAYFHEVYSWENNTFFSGSDIKLIFGNNIIDVIWSNRYMPLKNIILLNKNAINVIFKKSSEMRKIESTEKYDDVTGQEDSLIQILSVDRNENFGFLIRTVYAINYVKDDSICMVKIN